MLVLFHMFGLQETRQALSFRTATFRSARGFPPQGPQFYTHSQMSIELGQESPFHSCPANLANRRRKLVRTPVFASYVVGNSSKSTYLAQKVGSSSLLGRAIPVGRSAGH